MGMFPITTLNVDRHLGNRKVLFEKYNNVFKNVFLTDFKSPYWGYGEVNWISLEDCIKNTSTDFLLGEFFGAQELQGGSGTVVDLKNSTHIIKNIYIQDKVVYGTIQFLNTDKSQFIHELYLNNLIRTSLRATGTIENDVVQFHNIISFDMILDK